jgi:hypothetical protein
MRTRSSTQGGFACRYGFRAASGAARSAAGASGSGEAIGRGFGFTFGFRAASGAARQRCGSERFQRFLRGARGLRRCAKRQSGGDRSLWPEFWRFRPPRGSEPTAASRGRRMRFQSRERSSAKRCGSEAATAHSAMAGILANSGARSRLRTNGRERSSAPKCAVDALPQCSQADRSLWPEFWRIPAFAAPNQRPVASNTASPRFRNRQPSGFGFGFGFGEPRAKQREALRERAVPAQRAADCAAAQSGIRNAIRRRPLTLAGILANSGPRSRLRTNGRVASKHRFATLPEPSARRLRLWVRVRIQSRERSSAPALRERAVPPRQTGKAAHLAGLYNPARCSACGGLLRRLHRILVE